MPGTLHERDMHALAAVCGRMQRDPEMAQPLRWVLLSVCPRLMLSQESGPGSWLCPAPHYGGCAGGVVMSEEEEEEETEAGSESAAERNPPPPVSRLFPPRHLA